MLPRRFVLAALLSKSPEQQSGEEEFTFTYSNLLHLTLQAAATGL